MADEKAGQDVTLGGAIEGRVQRAPEVPQAGAVDRSQP